MPSCTNMDGARFQSCEQLPTNSRPTRMRGKTKTQFANNPDMAFEDLFEDDDDAKKGAYEEMIETAAMRNVFGEIF